MQKTLIKPLTITAFIVFALLVLNFYVFPLISPSNFAQAEDIILDVFEPRDKLVTEADRYEVKGRTQGMKELEINGEKVDILENGEFKAGVVFVPGKNLIRLSAKDIYGRTHNRIYRILRVVTFPDMEELYSGKQHWAKMTIINLATLSLIEGHPSGNFDPKQDVTKGEFATWIARAGGLKAEELKRDVFFDVPKEHWRGSYIKAVVDKGFMTGNSRDIFGINDGILRGEAARIANKMEGLQYVRPAKNFGDVSAQYSYASDVYTAYKGSLMKGVSHDRLRFEPKRDINRAEAASLIIKMKKIKNIAKNLFDFGKGYDNSRLCRVNTVPVIRSLNIIPDEAPPDGETVVAITAEVFDRQGLEDVSLVKVDLRELGGPPDASLYDDGTFGDLKADDGVYTLAITIPESVETGRKKILVTAMDRAGWESSKGKYILVAK